MPRLFFPPGERGACYTGIKLIFRCKLPRSEGTDGLFITAAVEDLSGSSREPAVDAGLPNDKGLENGDAEGAI